nr:hypothetical protein [Tanacetum cinerariifolium]
MIKVIKGEFEKLESIKISDVSLTCNTSLEIFNEEFNRMNRMEDDLFSYEDEIAKVTNIPCDLKKEDDSKQQMSHESDNDIEYGPSDVEFTKWAFKEFHYLLKIDLDVLTKDIDGFKTYEEYKDDCIYECNKDVPWVHEIPWTKNRWYTCSWKEDEYCNGGNLPIAYIIGNTLRYQDLEWYEALNDGKIKEEALKNKAIMDGMIDEDDKSSNEGWKRWDNFDNTNHDNEMEHKDEERSEVFDDHERQVCYIRRFKMINYSFRDNEEHRYAISSLMDTAYWMSKHSLLRWKRWDNFDNTNHDNEMEHEDEERSEVFDDHERQVCYIRRFKMIKYSFRDNEEYVAIKK